MSKDLLKGSAKVGLLTLVSRGLGFIWNLQMARTFGAGLFSDIFFVAYRIPNLLRSFLAEGALTSAFVPVFASDLSKDKSIAEQTLRSLISVLLVITICVSILGIIFAKEIVAVIAPGFLNDPEQFQYCVTLTRITFPYIIFVSLIALINGALTNLRIYGASPLAQITMNIVLISAALFAALKKPEEGIYIVSCAVIIGGFLQVLVQIPSLKRAKLRFSPSSLLITSSTKRILVLMLPAILGSAVYQINMFINTMLASFLPNGSISWLFYAERLTQLPIGIVTMAMVSVLLPGLSQAVASGAKKDFSKQLYDSLRYSSFLILPASVFLIVLAEPIVGVLFQRGSFNATDTIQTANAIKIIAFGLVFISYFTILNRVYLAKQNTKTPSYLALVILSLNLVFALLLMGDIKSTNIIGQSLASFQASLTSLFPTADLAHLGLAAAGVLANITAFILSFTLLVRDSSIDIKVFCKANYLSFILVGIYTIALFTLKHLIISQVLLLFLAIVLSPLFLIVVGKLIKSQEAVETSALLSRLLKRDDKLDRNDKDKKTS